MYPQYMFEQKYKNSQKSSTENCRFYSREKSLYIAWACFRNDLLEVHPQILLVLILIAPLLVRPEFFLFFVLQTLPTQFFEN